MKRMAVFVEGQTEQILLKKLVEEVAGANRVAIQSVKSSGAGSSHAITIITAANVAGQKFYLLIYDCTGDSRVLSEMLEQSASLSAQGYSQIVGLRDVYPEPPTRLNRLRNLVNGMIPHQPVPPRMIFAVMEVEAWFVAENTHFARIDHRLTPAAVNVILQGRNEDCHCELIPHPAATMHAVYHSVGRSYTKEKRKVSMIVDAVDFARLYLQLAPATPSLSELCAEIDAFLTA